MNRAENRSEKSHNVAKLIRPKNNNKTAKIEFDVKQFVNRNPFGKQKKTWLGYITPGWTLWGGPYRSPGVPVLKITCFNNCCLDLDFTVFFSNYLFVTIRTVL